MQSVHIESFSSGTSFNMIYVEGGRFMMGDELSKHNKDKPVHEVELDSFYICQYPITQLIWKTVMGIENNPSFFQGDNRPVETVSWDYCQEFIKRLNEMTGKPYRLPTEAEWEYAARGGRYNKEDIYAGSSKLEEVAWFRENSDEETKDVGQKEPNTLNLYDITGNIWEWCEDFFSVDYYQKCANQILVKNPSGPTEGPARVLRGGGWENDSDYCRLAFRFNDLPSTRYFHVGFRLAITLPKQNKNILNRSDRKMKRVSMMGIINWKKLRDLNWKLLFLVIAVAFFLTIFFLAN